MNTLQALAAMPDNQRSRWLETHRERLHGLAAAARNLAKPIRERIISDRTAKQYAADFGRVEKAGGVLAASGCRSSFWKLKAAAARGLAEQIYAKLAEADRIRKNSKEFEALKNMKWAACLEDEVAPLLDQLAKIKAEAWDFRTVEPRERCHRQRPKLGRLPKEWKERMWSRMATGKYADAVAVAAVAGVRPAELEKGVTVAWHGGKLVFLVYGAKVTEKNGQPQRSFTVAAGSPMADHLKRLAGAGPIKVRVESAKKLCTAFRKASALEFERFNSPPSIYALRHEFCAEAKGSLGAVEVAQVMGHASTASQQHYGTKQQGSGGLDISPTGKPNRAVRAQPPGQPFSLRSKANREARAIASTLAVSKQGDRKSVV